MGGETEIRRRLMAMGFDDDAVHIVPTPVAEQREALYKVVILAEPYGEARPLVGTYDQVMQQISGITPR